VDQNKNIVAKLSSNYLDGDKWRNVWYRAVPVVYSDYFPACTNMTIATETCKCGTTPSCEAGKVCVGNLCATVPICTDKAVVANQA